MDLTVSIVLWIHILAFVAGGSNAVVMPIIGASLETAPSETRAALYKIGFHMNSVGKIAGAILLISGPLLLWLKYNGIDGASSWFWVKMGLMGIMFVAIVLEELNFRKSASGDRRAAILSKRFGILSALSFAGVLLAAVFAFN